MNRWINSCLSTGIALGCCYFTIGFAQLLGQEQAVNTRTRTAVKAESISQVRKELQALVDERKIPGAVIVASWQGEIIMAEAFGTARQESREPMRRDSIFRIYSMTKAVTSVAIMQLVERGHIDLDKPISTYLDDLKALRLVDDSKPSQQSNTDATAPTVRDLLRHTSGLTYGIFGDTTVDRKYREANILARTDTNETLIKKLSRIPLLYEPGKQFHYGVSTDVLGRLVEVISSKPLDEYFQSFIFDPLEMSDTGFYVPKEKANRLVDNFGPKEGGGLQAIDFGATSPYLNKSAFLSGGGGLVSTADDYMRFCHMLCNQGQRKGISVLLKESIQQMTRNQIPVDALPIQVNGSKRPGVGFGLGFSVIVERIPGFEYVPVDEYGWSGAASTHFWISPKDELAVVVLSQVMPFTMRCESTVKPLIYQSIAP